MSNTAVLFNTLQPHSSMRQHHTTTAITTTSSSSTNNQQHIKMLNHNSNSPSRRHPGTTSTSVGTVVTKSTNSTNDHSIRRGADIVRKHIQQQQQHVIMNAAVSAAAAPVPSSRIPVVPSKPPMQLYDDDDEFLVHDSEEEVTTEDHVSVTSWSEYDALPTYQHHSRNGGDGGRYPRRNTGASSIEIDPPSIADWSIDVDDEEDDATTPSNHANELEEEEEEEVDSLLLEDSDYRKRDNHHRVETSRPMPAPIAHYDNTTMMRMMTHSHETSHPKHATPVGGFISSDDDDEGDEEEEKLNEMNKNQDDFDDSNSDIVEINDALFDPFQNGHENKAALVSSSSNKRSTKLLSTTPTATMVSYPAQEQRSPSNSIDPTNGGGSSSSSASDGSPYRHRTMGLSTSPNSGGIKKGYPLPSHIQESSPNSKKKNYDVTTSNQKNNIAANTTAIASNRTNFFVDYDVDAYCGYNADQYDDGQYDSPEKPVREVPIHTPSSTSSLSSPGMIPQPPRSYSTKYAHSKQKSSAVMIQYDQLLRDQAYLHAQNAGFIWQSIVGQHIRFPSTWWNGARGPPINSGYDNNLRHPSDTNNIPWMYFGRHTIPDHPVLNQLVKCRASAGRLLLHIVVQDLMTRTPIQDIVIGCFHPNSKGIRAPNSPALKRYENSRDIWMAVRKRSHTAVAATDSLIYSPSHWENPAIGNNRRTTASAYNYSISRSPLGSGQRVTNQNVRAVFGDKAPLETIFLSEDELYERLAARILQQQQNVLLLSSSGHNNKNTKSKSDSTNATSATTNYNDISPPLAILQELVFA